MAYEGAVLLFCPQNAFALDNAHAVVVSGDPPNTWGHMLLNTGGIGGTYFQVAGVHVCPRYMNEAGYRRYLKETGKHEIRRFSVRIAKPDAAQLKLEELLSKPWTWWGVVHNCESFAEEIIVAGGGRPIHKSVFSKPVKSRQETPGASGSW
jgi:hypothetical protein